MKKTFEVSITVEVEMDDKFMAEILPPFNEFIFDTDEEGLLSHIATRTAQEDDMIEMVGRNGKEYKAKVKSVFTTEIE